MSERLSIQPSLYACHVSTSAFRDKLWDNAKAACQSAGDRLAVFDSLESICWVLNTNTPREPLGKLITKRSS